MNIKKILCLVLLLGVFSSGYAQEDISKLDKNFAVQKVGNLNVVYHNALKEPFVLEGFPFRKEGEPLFRLPSDIKPTDISMGVYSLAKHTSGGVIRFRTDSPYITIRARIIQRVKTMGHMPATGSSGFDLMVDKDTYVKTVNPQHYKTEIPDPVEEVLTKNAPKGMHDYTLYLPLYNGVSSVEIGVAPKAKFEKPTPHKVKKPIVFYGSSITHGACASRTSLPYTALVCRDVDAPMINLGFSGNAKGEPKMAELIASLDMSVFVYDYDYNAPTPAHLAKTHEPFFKMIRKAHPNLPIVMLSRVSNASDERANIVKQTYENAKKAGDKNVWFIDGRDLFKDLPYAILTVDNCHPNDTGFYLMYKNVMPAIKEALKKSK